MSKISTATIALGIELIDSRIEDVDQVQGFPQNRLSRIRLWAFVTILGVMMGSRRRDGCERGFFSLEKRAGEMIRT